MEKSIKSLCVDKKNSRCATVAQTPEVSTLERDNKELHLQLQQRNKELNELNANLEKIVEQRTEALHLRSHVLQLAQDILEQIPLGVVGLDNENNIVFINSFALDLLGGTTPIILGDKAQGHFAPNLLAFIERVRNESNVEELLQIGANIVHVTGAYLNQAHERGVFITINNTNGQGSPS